MQQLAAMLAWAIERTFYVAGLGVHDYLIDEDQAGRRRDKPVARGAPRVSEPERTTDHVRQDLDSSGADPVDPIEISRTGPTAGGDVYSSLG